MSKEKNNQGLTAFGIASTYVGTIIGAGYASGQEILQFFNAFFEKGLISIVVATILFIVAGYVPMMLGKRLNNGDYNQVISIGKTRFAQIFSDIIIAFTLFSTLTIMIAASGTTFMQTFNWPLIVGGIIMCVLLMVSLFAGLDGIVKALSAVVPVMIVAAMSTALYFIINPVPVVDATKEIVVNSSPLIKHWSLSGVLYVTFNYVVAIAVNISLGQQARSTKDIKNGALYGGLILGACAFALYMALGKNLHIIGTSDLPIVDLVNTISPLFGSFYSVILFLGLYSTAISCFYGVYQRFIQLPALSKFGNNSIIVGITVVALSASMLGFSNLIGYVYPAIGYAGIVILGITIYKYSKTAKIAEEDTVAVQEKEKLEVKKEFK